VSSIKREHERGRSTKSKPSFNARIAKPRIHHENKRERDSNCRNSDTGEKGEGIEGLFPGLKTKKNLWGGKRKNLYMNVCEYRK